MKQGKLYKLIDFSTPIIVNHKHMLANTKRGGVLLTYKVKDVIYISLFGYNIHLFSKKSVKRMYFFNPLKQSWKREAYKISKIYWGKKDYLLTNLWLQVDVNFKKIHAVSPTKLAMIPQCKDKNLIKHLNFQTEKFIIPNLNQ